MLELSIICVIVLAAVYWAALWFMGRHSDVLYGSFVTPTQADSERRDWPPELPRRPRPATLKAAPPATLPGALIRQPQPLATVVPPGSGGTARQQTARQQTARQAATPPATSPQPTAPVIIPSPNDAMSAMLHQAVPAASHGAPWPLALPAQVVSPGTLHRALPATNAAPPSALLASLLEAIKQDLSEAARRS